MAKKRRRRLGHITKHESFAARNATVSAIDRCSQVFGGQNNDKFAGCLKGVMFVRRNLNKAGFEAGPTGY